MPVAKIFVPAAVITPEQRREIVKGVHQVINSVEGRSGEAQTYVLINEIPAGDWGSAGVVFAPPT
jgi:4-oxalocrotonate tautomerase family enzyme